MHLQQKGEVSWSWLMWIMQRSWHLQWPQRQRKVGYLNAILSQIHSIPKIVIRGFRGGSYSKEPACNAGNPGLIPGSGRSSGEGDAYPLQYSGLENSMNRGAWWVTVHRGRKELNMTEQLTLSLFSFITWHGWFWVPEVYMHDQSKFLSSCTAHLSQEKYRLNALSK